MDRGAELFQRVVESTALLWDCPAPSPSSKGQRLGEVQVGDPSVWSSSELKAIQEIS